MKDIINNFFKLINTIENFIARLHKFTSLSIFANLSESDLNIGLAFHFTRSSFRTSIYSNNYSLNHPVKKLLRSHKFSAKSYRIINLVHLPYLFYLKVKY